MKQLLTIIACCLGLLVSQPLLAKVVYVHNDVLGSPVMRTDANGNVISRAHYKPFGETLEAAKDDVGYTGHLNDTDLGLSYMQARYYDPVIGRFYSNDPVGFTSEVDTFNRYSYVGNNPYKYTDPTGMTKCIDKNCTRSSIDTDVDGDGTTDVTFVNNDPSQPSPPNNLETATAIVVENAIRDSGVDSVNINSTTGGQHGANSNHPKGGAVDIDKVNGQTANASNPGSQAIQNAAAQQPMIRENFGPTRTEKTITVSDPATGKFVKKTIQKPTVASGHRNHIHIGGRR